MRAGSALLLAALWVAGGVVSPAAGAVGRAAGVRAFPGAEGFGAYTPGGRGGKVIHVTNLHPSGPGSLQEACSTPGPRVVVFDVGGVIVGDVEIREPFITIAGQTAPSPGITIYGMLSTAYRPSDPVHDVIVRYLRVRARPGGGAQGDAIQFSVVDNAIIDHVSCSWAEDETIDIFTRATNITIQWCTIEESSTAGHPKGRHNYGLISGANSHHISIHHNLFAHHARRNPAIGSGPADFRSNVVYNFRDGFSHEGNYKDPGFNIIGNYYKRGPSDPDIFPFCFEDKVPYYLRGNYIEGVGRVDDPWADADKLYGLRYYAHRGVKADHEVTVAPVQTIYTAEEIYPRVLSRAGCFPRDVVTRRIVQDVKQGTGAWGRREPKDLLEGLPVGKPPEDTDRDGIPDRWEKLSGLDPAVDDSATVRPGSSYTAIELYINGIAPADDAEAQRRLDAYGF